MLWRSAVAGVLLLAVAGCGGTHLDASVAKRLEVAKADKHPAYWLGGRYDGLKLVYVESGDQAFFESSLYYADCSWLELNSMSPHCHRTVEVDNDVPAPGEISTMGRCIFSTTIHGVTVATFPVNSGDLRVFSRGATILVAARTRTASLQAIAALKPLNGHPLAHRDVSAALGTCKAPPPRPAVQLSAKQRYEQQMKRAFVIEAVGGLNLNAVDPVAAKPKLVLDEFLADTANVPPLVRNDADRIEQIHAPAAVAALHAQLVAGMRAYAGVLDDVRTAARRDGLDEAKWAADRRSLEPRLNAAASAVARTVRAYQARGYSIFAKSGD